MSSSVSVLQWRLSEDINSNERCSKVIAIIKPFMVKNAIIVLHGIRHACFRATLTLLTISGSPAQSNYQHCCSNTTAVLYPRNLYHMTGFEICTVGAKIAETYSKPAEVVVPEPRLDKALLLSLRCLLTETSQTIRRDVMSITYQQAQEEQGEALLCAFKDVKGNCFALCAYNFPVAWSNPEILTLHCGALIKCFKRFARDAGNLTCVAAITANFTPEMKQYKHLEEAGFKSASVLANACEPSHTCWFTPPSEEVFKEVIDYIFVNNTAKAIITFNMHDGGSETPPLTAEYPSDHAWLNATISWNR